MCQFLERLLKAALTGRPPSDYPRSVESCVEAPRLRQPIPVGNGMGLLARRPDVREAERKLAAATARIGIATAELYPRVTLGMSAGSTGALTDVFTTPTNRYGMGLGIHWQANQSITRAQIAAAGASARGLSRGLTVWYSRRYATRRALSPRMIAMGSAMRTLPTRKHARAKPNRRRSSSTRG